MKKIFLSFILITSVMMLSACTKPGSMFSISFFDYMDTYISINVYAADQKEADDYKLVIEDIYKTYHELSTNYEPLSENSEFMENIYSINQKNNQLIEIDEELYRLIEKAEEIRVLTDGYFDISIGEVVNVWKELLLENENGFLFSEIPNDIFTAVLAEIELIDLEEDVIELTTSNDRFYIQVKSSHAQLDLGAISKGYATQLVLDYIQELDIKYYSISAGSSSIAVGQNQAREGGIYNVSLANPVKTGSTDRTYGMIYVKDTGVTTSGDYEQYATHQNLRYHHIVSPKTKLPMQYYHTVTVLGDDLALLDALSTALFSMSPTTFNSWLDINQDSLNLEVIRFNYDSTIVTNMITTTFEENAS